MDFCFGQKNDSLEIFCYRFRFNNMSSNTKISQLEEQIHQLSIRIREADEQLQKQKEPLAKGKKAIECLELFNKTQSNLDTFLKLHHQQQNGFQPRLPDELRGQITTVLDQLAISYPALNCKLGALVAPYIDLDCSNYHLLDYWGIGLHQHGQYADSYLVFHCSVRPPTRTFVPPHQKDVNGLKKESKDVNGLGKETKDTKPTKKLRRRAFTEDSDLDSSKLWNQINPNAPPPEEENSNGKDFTFSIQEYHANNLKHIWENMQFPLDSLQKPPIQASKKIYVDNPKALRTICTQRSITTWKTPRQLPSKYHIFNPSMIVHPTETGKFLLNLRCGNYHMNMEKLGKENVYEYEGKVHTLNCLVTIDAHWKGDDFTPLHHVSKMIKEEIVPYPHNIAGCEDIRLIWNAEKKVMYATFTSLEQDASRMPSLCMTTLDWKKGRFSSPVIRMQGPVANRVEKNWVGFVHEGRLFFIYKFSPITIIEAHPTTGETRIVSLDAAPFNEWRGSSTPVELNPHSNLMDMLRKKMILGNDNDGKEPKDSKELKESKESHELLQQHQNDRYMLLIVHMSAFPRYSHKFIVVRLRKLYDANRPFTMQVVAQGETFVFQGHDVEFTCGMQLTPDGKELVLPYARRDEYAFCERYCAESIINSLQAVTSPDTEMAMGFS